MKPSPLTRMICGDSRDLDRLVTPAVQEISTVITSPPYLNTNDYGVPNQIGFGQAHGEYLDDLRVVFQHCWNLSTDNATMWIVVGAVRRSGRLVQLPEMLTGLASEIGWIPREQVTWSKGKSLPWARAGEFRDVTEQVILLSKSENFLFDLTDLYSPDPSSPWWVKYPERYSPRGRRPTNLWHIPIPTQGSWKPGLGHLCPFPNELTFRMISLTSCPGDAVLDPFAGIGTVPAMAEAMNRVGIGVEIAPSYVAKFEETFNRAHDWFLGRRNELEESRSRHDVFRRTIVELRLLKYGALICKRLAQNGFAVRSLHVANSAIDPSGKFKIVTGSFEAEVDNLEVSDDLVEFLQKISVSRPLSKFGIEPIFKVSTGRATAAKYWFKNGKFWEEPVEVRPETDEIQLTSDFKPRIAEVVEVQSEVEPII